ncbi:MAG: GNAT family N-acetyltransferase [Acidobacteriota bacterium]|nr:GNAT family N-acetyltransferase [Acidobacteriota bacterium]
MSVTTQLEFLDIRHFSARQLRPLVQEEARVWQQRLHWDYQSSSELILQYLDARILPGFVALDRGRVCGFTFCVYEGRKAVIGDSYSVHPDPTQADSTTEQLLDHLIQMLLHQPDIQRIESQLLVYPSGTMHRSFLQASFRIFPRLFMECDLRHWVPAANPQAETGNVDAAVELRSWAGSDYQAAAELIHACYLDHVDAQINDQYRTLHGCLRFLHNIVRFPGCGVFDAAASWVLRRPQNGALVGLVLCSRVAPEVAHITQICIADALRQQGWGHRLLEHCLRQLAGQGFSAATLTVTAANLSAVKLYEDYGFQVQQTFDAMVLDKP